MKILHSIKKDTISLISDSKINEALDLLLNQSSINHTERNNLLLLKKRYKKNKFDQQQGVITNEVYHVNESKICQVLLELISIEGKQYGYRKSKYSFYILISIIIILMTFILSNYFGLNHNNSIFDKRGKTIFNSEEKPLSNISSMSPELKKDENTKHELIVDTTKGKPHDYEEKPPPNVSSMSPELKKDENTKHEFRRGILLNSKGAPISNVRISIPELDMEFHTNEKATFEISIPPQKKGKKFKLYFSKDGFKTTNYYCEKSNKVIEYLLEKNN